MGRLQSFAGTLPADFNYDEELEEIICCGKSKLEKCTAEMIYKLAGALGVSMEMLTESGMRETKREQTYEWGLSEYLQRDLDAYKEGLRTNSDILDCLWGNCMEASIWRRSATV